MSGRRKEGRNGEKKGGQADEWLDDGRTNGSRAHGHVQESMNVDGRTDETSDRYLDFSVLWD